MIDVVGSTGAERLALLHARAFDRPWSAAEFARLLQTPTAFALAQGEEGFILAWTASDEAEILTVAVAPERRRRGVAALLVEAAGAVAASRGAAAMFLEVAADNAPARGLYAKLGFTEAGRRKSYYSDGGDAIVLRRGLPFDPVAVDSPSR